MLKKTVNFFEVEKFFCIPIKIYDFQVLHILIKIWCHAFEIILGMHEYLTMVFILFP